MVERQIYFGMTLSDAVAHVLNAKAADAARETAWSWLEPGSEPRHFAPWMSAEDIVAELQRGGFQFGSEVPLHEVDSALVNLRGVEKRAGFYKTRRADAILDKTTEFLTDHVRDMGNEWNAANEPPLSEDGADARE
jgi:hypothetical protein